MFVDHLVDDLIQQGRFPVKIVEGGEALAADREDGHDALFSRLEMKLGATWPGGVG